MPILRQGIASSPVFITCFFSNAYFEFILDLFHYFKRDSYRLVPPIVSQNANIYRANEDIRREPGIPGDPLNETGLAMILLYHFSDVNS